MTALQMIKIWHHDDSAAFINESYRFTTEGLIKYWMSVDSTIRYWFTAIGNKQLMKKNQKFRSSKFTWKKKMIIMICR